MRGRANSAVIAAIVAALAAPSSAHAVECMDREKVIQILARDYGEAIAGRGLADGGAMVELYRRPDGKTWTLGVTTPDQPTRMCIFSGGQSWQSFDVALPSEGL